MSNEFDVDENTAPADLRKLVDKLNAKLAAQDSELATFKEQQTAAQRGALLTAAGVPEAFQKFYTGDAAEASVKAWAEENKTLFPAASTDGAAASVQTPLDPNAQAAARVAGATSDLGGEIESLRSEAGSVGDPFAAMELLRNTPMDDAGYQLLVKAGLMPANPQAI